MEDSYPLPLRIVPLFIISVLLPLPVAKGWTDGAFRRSGLGALSARAPSAVPQAPTTNKAASRLA